MRNQLSLVICPGDAISPLRGQHYYYLQIGWIRWLGLDKELYLGVLESGVQKAVPLSSVDLVNYLTGAEPFSSDRFGRFSAAKEGLAERDRLVMPYCCSKDLLLAISLGGGCGRILGDTVDIHCQRVSIALELAGSL